MFESGKLFKSTGKPRPIAFDPEKHPDTGVLETSVCGMNGVQMARVWHLGATLRKKAAIACVEVPLSVMPKAALKCEAAPVDGYPEHGVILGWKADKSERLVAQQELAAAATATHRPPRQD